jgi:hypothetical protein
MNRTGVDAPHIPVEREVPMIAEKLELPIHKLSSRPDKLETELEIELAQGVPVVLTFLSEQRQSPVKYAGPDGKVEQPSQPMPRKSQPGKSWLSYLFPKLVPSGNRGEAVILAAFDGPKGARRYLVMEGTGVPPRMWDANDLSEVKGRGLVAFALHGLDVPEEKDR